MQSEACCEISIPIEANNAGSQYLQCLHFKMCVCGPRYPADLKAFSRSGMKGVWDRERAGQRMKLKEPETWERLLSMQGNKAATWEKLIGLLLIFQHLSVSLFIINFNL